MLASMTYPGGKNGAGVYHRLINLMPPHDVYIEPFLGSGAIMRLKRPAELNIGVDRDPRALSLVRAWGDLHSPDRPRSAAPAPDARTGDGGRPRQNRCFSRDARSGDAAGRLAGNGAVRSQFLFHESDGIEFLRGYRFTGAELVYCDPPYLLSSRSHPHENIYHRGFEMTDLQHRDLLRLLLKLPCRVMISGYAADLYDKMLRGWNTITYQAATHRGPREEWLWFNFAPPTDQLHDYQFLGATWRARERFARKKKRWLADMLRMPTIERNALLAAIAEHASSSDAAGSTIAVSGGEGLR